MKDLGKRARLRPMNRFGKKSAPKAYELTNQLTTNLQDGTFVSAYYTKFRSLRDEIQSIIPHHSAPVMGVPLLLPTAPGCTVTLVNKLLKKIKTL